MTSSMDRTRLAAFVDGELSPEEAAVVVMHLADHPADQVYVDDLFAANAALAAAFDAPMREPVPERLLRMLEQPSTANVLPFRHRFAALGGLVVLAASLAGVGLLVSRQSGVELAVGSVPAGGTLAELLDNLPSGTSHADGRGGEFMVLATLPTPEGHCREVELIDRNAQEIALGLACRAAGEGWKVEAVLAEPLEDVTTQDGFLAADGAVVQGLAAFLDGKRAGAALSPAQEAALIDRGWDE